MQNIMNLLQEFKIKLHKKPQSARLSEFHIQNQKFKWILQKYLQEVQYKCVSSWNGLESVACNDDDAKNTSWSLNVAVGVQTLQHWLFHFQKFQNLSEYYSQIRKKVHFKS